MKKPDLSKFAQKFEDAKGFVWDKMCEDSGNIFLYFNVFGYFSSMFAQLWTTVHNEKLSKKDKNYMAAQDVTEGLTNVSVSLVLGMAVKKLGDWLLETGRLEIDGYKEFFSKIKIGSSKISFTKVLEEGRNYIEENKSNFIVDYKNQKKPLTFILENLLRYTTTKTEPGNFTKKILISDMINDFNKIKGGMGFLTTLAASLIVFCGISPILKNKTAGVCAEYIKAGEQEQFGANLGKMLHHSSEIYAKKYNFTGLNPLSKG